MNAKEITNGCTGGPEFYRECPYIPCALFAEELWILLTLVHLSAAQILAATMCMLKLVRISVYAENYKVFDSMGHYNIA
jgi:hypothetical protein